MTSVPGGDAYCPLNATTNPLDVLHADHTLLLSHQPDELLSFLVDVLSDNQPSSSDDSSTESSVLQYETTSSTAPSTTADKANERAPQKTITVATRKRNKYRDQMKKELHKQRALVVELEAEVLAFRQGKIVVTSDDRAKLSSAWRRIAKSQLTYRRQAEAENTRLKLELQRTIHITQSIRHLLGDKRGQSYTLGPQLKPRKRALSQFQDADGFEELVVDIDTSFRLLDAVFRESGLDRVTSELAKSGRIKTYKNGGGRQYLELTNVSIMPFDIQMTADNLWSTLLNIYLLQNGPGTEQIWRTDDFFAVRYHPEDYARRELPPSKLVMKKFTCASDKIVVVWRACSQLTGSLLGTMADETGWTTIQPIADNSGFQSLGSITRTCVHFVQKPSTVRTPPADSRSSLQSSIEAFSDVIVGLSKQDQENTDKNYGGRQYLELTSAAIEPFDSRMIPDKLWQALVYSFQNGPGRKLIWETEDAFAVRYHPEDLVHQELPRSKLVMKKFSTGSDKIAVVWRASSELTGNFLGTTADETGWVAVQPIADSSGFQSSGSISRSCVHFVQNPVTPVGVLGSRPQSAIEVFSDVILNLSIQERGAVLKMMENLLLDDTIASTG
uniref:START domain-containing protein n=1 Tax=Globisporangium ultimum (strain ATCC 200006 / CBS 805.95 / DAOM BR144) TaxID=431595 RepID=K3W9H4_GLOUD